MAAIGVVTVCFVVMIRILCCLLARRGIAGQLDDSKYDVHVHAIVLNATTANTTVIVPSEIL